MTSDTGETLTDSMLAALPAHLRPIRAGKYLRAGCPFHGSDTQRSLSINPENGRFECFSCQVWGYTERAREDWKERHKGQRPPPPWQQRSGVERMKLDGAEPEPLPPSWLERLAELQARLPEAAEYLARRHIPLELVARLGGGVGEFPREGRARALRIILPHTDPQGRVVSLYGRRIDGGEELKHYHLSRQKGFLNAQATQSAELWLTEGPFDALALMAAGIPNAAAVFGVSGIRWGWLRDCRRIVLAFDADEAGRKAILNQARQALMRGVRVEALTEEELGGAKDVAEAWERGTLRLDGAEALPPDELAAWRERVAALPGTPPPGLPPMDWEQYRALANRFVLEHGAAARAAGWGELELFGLPDPVQPWNGGALWGLAGCEVREVTPDAIHAATPRGGPLTARRAELLDRGGRPALRLPWGSALD